MKRKKRRGKEGFPIEDQKKVKRKKIGGKQNSSQSIKETKKENNYIQRTKCYLSHILNVKNLIATYLYIL